MTLNEKVIILFPLFHMINEMLKEDNNGTNNGTATSTLKEAIEMGV